MPRTRTVVAFCAAALVAAVAAMQGQAPAAAPPSKPALENPAPQKPSTARPTTRKPATQKPSPQKPPVDRTGAAPFPAAPPEPGVPRDFKVPEPKRFTLDNGLHVALVQWGTMPKVRVTLGMRTGNAFEKADEVWLADLT